MRNTFSILIILLSCSAIAFAQKAPQTLALNGEMLLKNRIRLAGKKDSSLDMVLNRADKIVKSAKLFSVMDKSQIPPSGDKHDYMSQAPYWWADPAIPDGLPYIRRDGERNPELNKISDTKEMDELVVDVETTALAYFFSGKEEYAKHSAALIRTWFLDAKTRQNPNLNFSQGIPGINKGRGIGLIESRELYRVIDSAILLQTSKSWSEADHQALKKWFADFLKWIQESDLGKDESKEKNNHGTHYDLQIIAYSIFTDKPEIARKQIENSKQRIKSQFEKDGRQPLELARTKSWGYSSMNLNGFFTIALLAENVGIDLWNFETDGKSLKRTLDWLVPFAKGESKWTTEQITKISYDDFSKNLFVAAKKYKSKEYEALAKKLSTENLHNAIFSLQN